MRRRDGVTFIAVLGGVGCVLGLVLEPKTMLASYLAVAVAAASVPLGALGVLMTTYLAKARWTADMHPPLSRLALLTPYAGLLFVPVVAGMGVLYPWVHAPPHGNLFQAIYLTPSFFALRTVFYFATASALAALVVRSYGDGPAMERNASAGLIVWALVVSFAGVDWLESVQPEFHSSIYGLLFLVSVLLAGFAGGLVAVLVPARHRGISGYGATLMSLLLLWVYMHAMQYLIIWSGNLPEEMIWYVERLRGGWGVALWALYSGQFIIPFLALISARVRNYRKPVLTIVIATLALRVLEAVVMVVPAVPVHPWFLLLDLPSEIALVGGLAALAWFWPLVEVRRVAAAMKR